MSNPLPGGGHSAEAESAPDARTSRPRLPIFDRTVGQAIQEGHDLIEQAKARYKPEATFLLFSGGGDSTVLLDTMWEHADAIVHINTGIGIEEAHEHARRVAAKYDRPLIEKEPPIAYDDLVLDPKILNGMPGPGAHGITFRNLKERCIEALLRDHRERRGQRFLLISGIRKGESKRRSTRKRQALHRNGGQVWANALFGVTNDEMREYRTERQLPVSEVSANLHMSGECLCGAMADQGPERAERQQLRFFYPKFDERLCGLEEECKSRGLRYTEWGVKRPDMGGEVGEMCSNCPTLFGAQPVLLHPGGGADSGEHSDEQVEP